ncbi:sensor histidine kinase [Paraburkholderia acidiphila]|uniref:histidine kinase n=1 Tax=Paraburkholderia acidiphila TaxID=2571747 RepID=A0A7Z2JCF2_9BURK|nr:ATP-binding protein [Paraburkholderia acidiphila]QGZ59526.1 sensor histidine kinase [Paraburkholderia acidiphila]
MNARAIDPSSTPNVSPRAGAFAPRGAWRSFEAWSRPLWVLLAAACAYASYATHALPWQGLVRFGLPLALPVVLVAALIALRFVELHVSVRRIAVMVERSLGVEAQPFLPEDTGPALVARLARAFNGCTRHRARRQAELLHVLAAYAHDLRTPLTRMTMRSELVEEAAIRDALARDLAEMSELVEGSLSCARMQCSAHEPMRCVDADSLLRALIADYRDAGRTVELEGQVGRPVVTCPHALRRVLVNLIDNALRYGVDVRLSVRVEAQRLVLAVLDSGPGIVPARLETVFAAWYRAPETAAFASGSGLGLAIARRLTLAMRGELELENRRTGGLEARLTLPLAAA